MSKWNAKINPKLSGEGKNEDLTSSVSPKNERLLRKPNTAHNQTRARHLKSSLNYEKTNETNQSTC